MTVVRLVIAALVAFTAAPACGPWSRLDAPKAPPAPEVRCADCVDPVYFSGTGALRVTARWASHCVRHELDGPEENPRDVECKSQPFRAKVTCDRPCEIIHTIPQVDVFSSEAFFAIAPRAGGKTIVSVDLTRTDTGEPYHWQTEPFFVYLPEQIELLCFDSTTKSFASCSSRPLDSAHAFVSVGFSKDGQWTLVTPSMFGKRSAEDVFSATAHRPDLPVTDDLRIYSLAAILDVDPVPPGDYTLELDVNSTKLERTLRVR
jgi:hypothetical protein